MKPSEQLRELVERWKARSSHLKSIGAHAKYDSIMVCIVELELLIPAVEQLEQAQRERDEVIRKLLIELPLYWPSALNMQAAIDEIIQKLGGAE